MSNDSISFQGGSAFFGSDYERMMGGASRLVGEAFLDWMAPLSRSEWIDIGCGNGAFTRLVVERCAPLRIVGIDPSASLLDYARRMDLVATYRIGDALSLPVGNAEFDLAAMALVLFFLDDPTQGVSEMVRVVRPDGLVCAYLWDVCETGGYPHGPLQEELNTLGLPPIMPPSAEISRIDTLRSLWSAAGLTEVEIRQFTITRSFNTFDDYWSVVEVQIGLAQWARELTPDRRVELKRRLWTRMSGQDGEAIFFPVRANAVIGRKAQ